LTFVHRETVRFDDCDPLGHLDDATYSTFLERARLAYFGAAAARAVDGPRRHARRRHEAVEIQDRREAAQERAESGAKRSGRTPKRRMSES
jgi:hypothetical protein